MKGLVMNEFFAWANLGTFAGCVAATAIITQFIKNVLFFKSIATQWISYGIAVILLFGSEFFTGTLTPASGALIPFNAILISLSANGAYTAVHRWSDVSIKK
jgi:hypothetical protein